MVLVKIKPIREFLWILLLPIAILWCLITTLRRFSWKFRSKKSFHVGVVSVGNIHSGGSGKTPVTLAIADHYAQRVPVILSRGYRGVLSSAGARVERNAKEGSKLYGDEPWMLAQLSPYPIYIGKKRTECVGRILDEVKTSLIILDDGFQVMSLKKNIDLVLIDTSRQVNEGYSLPLGDLREPFRVLKRADAIILVGKRGGYEGSMEEWFRLASQFVPSSQIFSIWREVRGIWQGLLPYEPKKEESWVAFCGIANPERFAEDVRSLGNVTFVRGFRDHHKYQESDLDLLEEHRRSINAKGFLTTDKDWFKLREHFANRNRPLFSLRIGYHFPQEFWGFLDQRLRELPGRRGVV